MRDVELATVLEIDAQNNIAKVKIDLKGYCKDCVSHSICPVNTEKGFQINAVNLINANVNDKVMIEYKPENKIYLSFVVFVFPIIFLIIGYLITYHIFHNENMGILGAFIGFIISFLVIILYNKKYKKKVTNYPLITKRIMN